MGDIQLLFFDTFVHSAGTDLNLDLVNFNTAVYISEVRIIPLGTRVCPNLPGGERMGATNPSQFILDFFVNDLSKSGMSVFQKLGSINYDQKGNISLDVHSRTPTDGLVLRGWYSAVTLAVYGSLTRRTSGHGPSAPASAAASSQLSSDHPQQRVTQPAAAAAAPAVAAARSRVANVCVPELSTLRTAARTPPAAGSNVTHTDQDSSTGSCNQPPEPPLSSHAHDGGLDDSGGTLCVSTGDMEAISDDDDIPDAAPGPESDAAAVSPVAAAAASRQSPSAPGPRADAAFEDIMSDEEPMDDVAEYGDGDPWDDALPSFNPETFQPHPLKTLKRPWLTGYELSCSADVLADPAAAGGRDEYREVCELLDTAHQTPESLVETLERLAQLMEPVVAGQLQLDDPRGKDRLDAMASLLQRGLDYELAAAQPLLPYKIRQLKSALRLSQRLLDCGEPLSRRLVQPSAAGGGLLAQLLQLDGQPYMAVSLRLMVARALSAAVRWPSGLKASIAGGEDGKSSCYQRVVTTLVSKQSSRLKAAYTNVVRKVHVYRMVGELCSAADELGSLDVDRSTRRLPVAEELVATAESCLSEICELVRDADALLGQNSTTALPVRPAVRLSSSTTADCPTGPGPLCDLLYMLHWCGLLPAVLVLMSTPLCLASSSLLAAVETLLTELMSSSAGLLMLACSEETTGALLSCLLTVLSGGPEGDDHGCEELHPLYQTGITLSYNVQVLQLLDAYLAAAPESDKQTQALLSLTCVGTSAGRGCEALVHVLTRPDDGSWLLPLLAPLTPPAADSTDQLPASESAAALHCRHLLLTVVRHASECSPALCRLARQPDLPAQLRVWLPAADQLDDVTALCQTVREQLERAAAAAPDEQQRLTSGLLPALRRLVALVDNEQLSEAAVQLCAADGCDLARNVLARLSATLPQPAAVSAQLVGQSGRLLVSTMLCAVRLLGRLVSLVAAARGPAFADLTAVGPLIDTYLAAWAVPAAAAAARLARRLQDAVVRALLAYTQPPASAATASALASTPWSRMVWMACDALHGSPLATLPAMSLLTELLPLPLPVQSLRPLTADETAAVRESRTLWGGHLVAAAPCVPATVACLCRTSCTPLLVAGRRLLVQMADLSAASAQLVANALLDAVQEGFGAGCPDQLSRALGLLAGLVTYPCIKSATLWLLSPAASTTTGPSHQQLSTDLLQLLTSRPSTVTASSPLRTSLAQHRRCQEAVATLLQALCDAEIHMPLVPAVADAADVAAESTSEKRTGVGNLCAAGLPPPSLLSAFTTALLSHLACPDAGCGSLLLTLRTLIIITESEHGLYRIKACLSDDCGGCLVALLVRQTAAMRRRSWGEDVDSTAVLQATLELLRVLADAAFTPEQLAAVLRWCEQGEEAGELVDPPLRLLHKRLQQETARGSSGGGCDDALRQLRDGFAELMATLHGVEDVPKQVDAGEPPTDPPPRQLQLVTMFQRRAVVTLADDEPPAFWLLQALDQELDSGEQLVSVNLGEVSKELSGPLDLPAELTELLRDRSLLLQTTPTAGNPSSVATDRIRQSGAVPDAAGFGPPNRRRPAFFNMSGSRGAVHRQSVRSDHFRSRPPNTSRPPSLHVDDFVALERRGAHPIGPTGYNAAVAAGGGSGPRQLQQMGRGRLGHQGRIGGRGRPRGATADFIRSGGAGRMYGRSPLGALPSPPMETGGSSPPRRRRRRRGGGGGGGGVWYRGGRQHDQCHMSGGM